MKSSIFNLSIKVEKINKETSTILRVLKGIKHNNKAILYTPSERLAERKHSINKGVLSKFTTGRRCI